MKTKPLSMKKLYQLATDYLSFKYVITTDSEIIKQANKDMAELDRYLRYVWEHRND